MQLLLEYHPRQTYTKAPEYHYLAIPWELRQEVLVNPGDWLGDTRLANLTVYFVYSG